MNQIAREYNAYSAREVAQKLCDAKVCLILFHVHPDGDATGSAFALKVMLESIGKKAYCICDGDIPERLKFIMRGQDSVVRESIPEGLIPDIILSVDTASPSQLGGLYDVYKDKINIMIDHHKMGTFYADRYIDCDVSACGEVLYSVFENISLLCGKEIPFDVKYLVYTAISSDTGCFRYNNVKPSTFALASELLASGVPTADINHKLFGIKSLKQMQVEHAGFERMNFYSDGKIAVITFPYDLKKQYGAEDENLETLIDVARCIKGVEVAAVVKQPTEDKRYRVSLRSSTDFDVSKVCSLYGGGGHERAAGCTLVCDSILAAEITIVSAIENAYADMNLSENR